MANPRPDLIDELQTQAICRSWSVPLKAELTFTSVRIRGPVLRARCSAPPGDRLLLCRFDRDDTVAGRGGAS